MRTALGLPDPWNEVSEIRREVALADAQLGEDEVAVLDLFRLLFQDIVNIYISTFLICILLFRK